MTFNKSWRWNVLIFRLNLFGCFRRFLLLFLFTVRSSLHCLLDPSFKFVRSVLIKPERVVFLFLINPLPVLILIFLEVLNFMRRSLHAWLLEICRQVSFPIRINKIIVEAHKSMNLRIRPFIEVN